MNLIAMLMLAADLNGQPLPDVVLLDFTAGYCQPCQQMVPVLQRMEKDQFPVRKIDITEQPELSQQYKVDRIPTLILIVEGQEVRRFVGLTAEQELRQAMNEAARKLDQARKASGAVAQEPARTADSDAQPAVPAKTKAAPRPGIRGVFDRMRRGLAGDAEDSGNPFAADPPDFRGQSPDDSDADADLSAPMQATVRVRLMDGNLRDVGTGTIIQSSAGQSTILTCAHIFQKVNDQAAVEVDVFQNGKALKYSAQVLGGDHESDVALLRIQNTTPLPTTPLAAMRRPLGKNEPLFSIGCSNGDVPTRLNMAVIEVDRYNGPENILCTNDPAKGRSGGGLFDAANRLVGVCSAADRKAHEGLYTGIKPVRKLISELKLDSLFDKDAAPFEPSETPKRIAERTAEVPKTSFRSDDNLFDEFFREESGLSEFAEEESSDSAPAFSGDSHRELPNPFDAAPLMTATADVSDVFQPTEITVIIDSPDPAKGKQVIVIPRPSPWLLELLTGEKPAQNKSGLATARDRSLSATSSRRTARKVSRGSYLPLAH